MRVKDKYGDLGVVGVAIIRYESPSCEIDTLLLSCRALGRGVQAVLLRACLNSAKKNGISYVIGTYIRTKKNTQVADFYEEYEFRLDESRGEDIDKAVYRFDLDASIPPGLDYFKSVETGD